MNVLIDTNTILDAMLARSPFKVEAQRLFLLTAEEKMHAFITASSVTDIYYLLRKHIHSDIECKQALFKLFTLFGIVDVTADDCERALELPMADYEDALITVCAKRAKIDYIITRNVKDFIKSPVKAISPNYFLENLLES